jgi:hypothetical protein
MTYAFVDGPTVTTWRRFPDRGRILWRARLDESTMAEFETDADIDEADLYHLALEALEAAKPNP